jgi:glutamate-1-semialdehyde 2,1-aminomutase
VPKGLAEHTLTLQYNDAEGITRAFAEMGDEIACIIVEPVAGNMNLVPPVDGFLETLRTVCTDYGAVLIFDEVMTGFRVARGGAQALYDIKPDLTTLGKIVGGGMPAAAFGGRADIMRMLAPEGPVYQAGTLSGNPLAMTAGLATLKAIQADGFYEQLGATTTALCDGLQAAADAAGIAVAIEHIGGMFGLVFSDDGPIRNFSQVAAADVERFKQFFHSMLAAGIYLAPSAFEAGFVSIKHGEKEIEHTLDAARASFDQM